jgi:hypothetical protein
MQSLTALETQWGGTMMERMERRAAAWAAARGRGGAGGAAPEGAR